MDKRGVLGLDNAKVVITTILILAVLAIAILISVSSLISTASTIPINSGLSGSFVNKTINLSTFGASPAPVATLTNVVMSNVILLNANATGNELINANNYTVVGNLIIPARPQYNNTLVNVTASYTYGFDNGGNLAIQGNVTSGLNIFFGNTTTIFNVLAASIVIGAIALILGGVLRLKNKSESAL